MKFIMKNVEKDVVLEKVKKETVFINKKTYQKIKKRKCKNGDYFTKNELKKMRVIYIL